MTKDLGPEYAGRYWSLGNAVCGFVVLQNLSFGLAWRRIDDIQMALTHKICPAVGFLAVSLALIPCYVFAVHSLMKRELNLLGEDASNEVKRAVAYGFRIRAFGIGFAFFLLYLLTMEPLKLIAMSICSGLPSRS